jgi:hypothetical protein
VGVKEGKEDADVLSECEERKGSCWTGGLNGVVWGTIQSRHVWGSDGEEL